MLLLVQGAEKNELRYRAKVKHTCDLAMLTTWCKLVAKWCINLCGRECHARGSSPRHHTPLGLHPPRFQVVGLKAKPPIKGIPYCSYLSTKGGKRQILGPKLGGNSKLFDFSVFHVVVNDHNSNGRVFVIVKP